MYSPGPLPIHSIGSERPNKTLTAGTRLITVNSVGASYLQLMQTASSLIGVPVLSLMNFNWSTGAKYLPHLSHACILKVRPQIFRFLFVDSIRMCSVGHTYAHAPQPIHVFESSMYGGPTAFFFPLPAKPMAFTPTTSSQAFTQRRHSTHFPLSVSG